MEVSFGDLKFLVTVVADDLLKDDFNNLLDGFNGSDDSITGLPLAVSDEIYSKIYLLSGLLNELYKHRPLPF